MATRIVGIDFGTSTTVVRVHNIGEDNRVVPLAVNGNRTIPTIAFESADGEVYYGYDAKAMIDSNAPGVERRNFKMDLISEDEEVLARAEKLINGFMHYIYERYQNHSNAGTFDPVDEVKVYVSHPAKWTSSARTLMKRSVAEAGFCCEENVSLKDEPTAAILAVMHEKKEVLNRADMLRPGKKYKVMMIDMGAGTTDIVLCTYHVVGGKLELGDIFTYPSVNTPGLCGGREIDDIIVKEAGIFVNNMQEKPSIAGKNVVNKFKNSVKDWKEQILSAGLRNNMEIPEPDAISQFRDDLLGYGFTVMNGNERFTMNRDFFERVTEGHWKQWGRLLHGAFEGVQDAQYQNLACAKGPEEVELLIVTGGHSQWYVVPEYLLGRLRMPEMPEISFTKIQQNPDLLLQSVDPQETVAVGLCHLDEDVVGTIAASNDISISFFCEDKFLGSCELIKKGVALPFAKTDYILTNTIKCNFILNKVLTIDYRIITDHKNVVPGTITIPADSLFLTIVKIVMTALGLGLGTAIKLVKSIFSGKLNELGNGSVIEEMTKQDMRFKLSPDLYINEEGIIKVGGTITVDDNILKIPEVVI